ADGVDLAGGRPAATAGGAAGDPEHDGAVPGDRGADRVGGGRGGTAPQVGQRVAARAALADRADRGGDGGGTAVLVEQRHRDVAVRQRLGEDVQAAGGGDLSTLLAQRVLVNRDDSRVRQGTDRRRA